MLWMLTPKRLQVQKNNVAQAIWWPYDPLGVKCQQKLVPF